MYYSVKQGDHLTKVADQFGFTSYDTIWNHPSNTELKKQRGNPNLLMPGDEVFIPDKEVKTVDADTGALHLFKLQRSPLKLRVVFLDVLNKPFANAKGKLEVGADSVNSTDGDGRMELVIPATADDGQITLPGGAAVIHVGHLDPLDEESGLRARLANLGYLIGAVEDADDTEELRFAVQEFQADHGLDVSGVVDDPMRTKLRDVYGC